MEWNAHPNTHFFFLNSFLSLTLNISCAKKFWLQNINTSTFHDHCSFHSGSTHNRFSFRLLPEFPNCSPYSHSVVPIPHRQQKLKVAQSCPSLYDPTDYSLPRSSLHGILQARTLEWIMIVFSRGSSQTRNETQVSWIAGGFFIIWATREAEWVFIIPIRSP